MTSALRSGDVMRALILASCLVPVFALADPPKTPSTNIAPINLTEIPEQCKPIAKQAGATSLQIALSARISLANCLADVKLAPMQLLDCEASMIDVDDAVEHSFALLDEVVAATTEDTTKIIAEQARAEIYAQMTTRMHATLPPPGTTEASIVMHGARKDVLDLLLARWRSAGAKSLEKILAIVKANPKLERNPAVAAAVRTAKDRLRLHVATAKPVTPQQPVPLDERDAVITDEEQLR